MLSRGSWHEGIQKGGIIATLGQKGIAIPPIMCASKIKHPRSTHLVGKRKASFGNWLNGVAFLFATLAVALRSCCESVSQLTTGEIQAGV